LPPSTLTERTEACEWEKRAVRQKQPRATKFRTDADRENLRMGEDLY
jgi:hypothetical protein